jgi:hypothetical protein
MFQARIAGEQLPVLARAGKQDAGAREAAFGGIQQHAGHRHIGPQGHPGQHKNRFGLVPAYARNADTAIARGEFCRVHPWRGFGNGLRHEVRVEVAQGRLEAVRQAFHDDAQQRFGAVPGQRAHLGRVRRLP